MVCSSGGSSALLPYRPPTCYCQQAMLGLSAGRLGLCSDTYAKALLGNDTLFFAHEQP